MDEITFKTDLVPTFNKMKIEKNVPFNIRPLLKGAQFEGVYQTIYNGILYNFLLQVEEKEELSYEEYLFLSEAYLKPCIFGGQKMVFYGETLIVSVSKFSEKLGISITPVYGTDIKRIRKDIRRMTKQEIEERDAQETKVLQACLDRYAKD